MTESQQPAAHVTIRGQPENDGHRLFRELSDRITADGDIAYTNRPQGDVIELKTADLEMVKYLVTLFAPGAGVTGRVDDEPGTATFGLVNSASKLVKPDDPPPPLPE